MPHPLFSGALAGGGGGDVGNTSGFDRGITDSYIGSLSFITTTLPFGMIPFVSSGGVISMGK